MGSTPHNKRCTLQLKHLKNIVHSVIHIILFVRKNEEYLSSCSFHFEGGRERWLFLQDLRLEPTKLFQIFNTLHSVCFLILFTYGDQKNVPTRSKLTGINILVGTFCPHNVMNTGYTQTHTHTHTHTLQTFTFEPLR